MTERAQEVTPVFGPSGRSPQDQAPAPPATHRLVGWVGWSRRYSRPSRSRIEQIAQRLTVWLLVGGVFGFGSVFLEVPGAAIALVGLLVLAFTTRSRGDLTRVAGYLAGVGLVGGAITGPALNAPRGSYVYATLPVVFGYAFAVLAGSLLAGWLAVEGLRRRKRTP